MKKERSASSSARPTAKPRKPRTTTRQPRSKADASAAAQASGQVEASPAPMPSAEEVQRRAYELFRARGGVNGDPLADWLQAERELSGEA